MTARVVAHISPEGVVRGDAAAEQAVQDPRLERFKQRATELARALDGAVNRGVPQWTRITAELWEPDPAA